MEDGGVIALVGFLYQLLGSAAGLADAVITDKASVLYVEPRGEDALLRTASEDQLVQFKFSGTKEDIRPGDLADIISKLNSHSIGSEQWVLVTNRKLTDACAHLRANGAAPSPLVNNVKRENRELIIHYNHRLRIVTSTFEDFEKKLFSYGRLFGLLDTEIKTGIRQVVGNIVHLVKQNGANVPIDASFLDELLVGFKQPGKLSASDRAPDLAKELITVARNLGGPTFADLIPRDALSDLMDVANPVVVVEGPGGVGKTVSVLLAIYTYMLDAHVLGMHLRPDDPSTFHSTVTRWRSPDVSLLHEDRFDLCLKRLQTANSARIGHIAVVALDGLDESGWRQPLDRRAHARTLLYQALGRQPEHPFTPAQLKVVVTCRDKSDVQSLLQVEGTGSLMTLPEPAFVKLEEFSSKEFDLVWERWLRGLKKPVWQDHRGADSEEGGYTSMEDQRLGSTSSDERLRFALRNPTILGRFRNLTRLQQEEILDGGDSSSWDLLMDGFINWFLVKTNRRHEIDLSNTKAMLRTVAQGTQDRGQAPFELTKHWITPASTVTGLPPQDARRLFDDALSSGLVETSGGSSEIVGRGLVFWGWRYEFLRLYLSSIN